VDEGRLREEETPKGREMKPSQKQTKKVTVKGVWDYESGKENRKNITQASQSQGEWMRWGSLRNKRGILQKPRGHFVAGLPESGWELKKGRM